MNKKLLFLLWSLVIGYQVYAQTPQAINYQAIARNSSGNLLQSQAISVRFSVMQDSSPGTLLYQEIHQTVTTDRGLFTLGIGRGAPSSGTFGGIDWTTGNKFLKVEVDPNGNTNFLDMGTNRLESVPYALVAQKVIDPPAISLGDLTDVDITVTPDSGQVLRWDGTQWVPQSGSGYWAETGSNIHNNNSGNVGIGTNSPLVPLHVFNPLSSSEGIRLEGNNTWLAFYDGSLYDGFLWNNFGNIGLGTSHLNPSGKLHIYTYGTERMVITEAGRVGIGITVPSYKLHVEDPGIAIHGRSTSNYGLYGYSSGQIGIYGYSNSLGSAGIFGQSAYIGVEGITNSTSTDGARQGIRGDNYGSATGWAGYFYGNVGVSGTLTKGAGAFRIDHPLDPANKFLYHSFVESPDMKNIYDGVVITNGAGETEVELPDWFEALNGDFRYQLTVIGQFAQAIVSEEIHENRFKIKTDQPGVKVSWQVTGIRHDPYAEHHPIPLEVEKNSEQKGKYLHPDVYGRTIEDAIDYHPINRVQPD